MVLYNQIKPKILIVSEYNYLALPVLNANDELIGIVTVDDVMDVIREEATEDMRTVLGLDSLNRSKRNQQD